MNAYLRECLFLWNWTYRQWMLQFEPKTTERTVLLYVDPSFWSLELFLFLIMQTNAVR